MTETKALISNEACNSDSNPVRSFIHNGYYLAMDAML